MYHSYASLPLQTVYWGQRVAPLQTPTPIPTPTPTPRPIFGCCDLGLACENITNVECAEMQGLFLPGGFCISGGCRTTPPPPTPPPLGCCVDDGCTFTTSVSCWGDFF